MGKPRIFLAKGLFQLSHLVQRLAILAMKPQDLINFSLQTYRRPDIIANWSADEVIDAGLYDNEMDLVHRLPARKGELLVLGTGTGREAIAFAKLGYTVTGVDFVTPYLERAMEKAKQANTQIKGITGDISSVVFPPGQFDVIWFSGAMYSSIPGRKRRLKMLQNLKKALAEKGVLVCQFHMDERAHDSRKEKWLKFMAAILRGDNSYESGDILWRNVEFLHAFKNEDDFTAELIKAGFHKNYFIRYSGGIRGGSIWTPDTDKSKT